jgi:hypothetical protein
MYARVGGRMLLFLMRAYVVEPSYVRSTNSTQTYAGPHRCMRDHTDVYYFLEYPLDNTWTYAAPFGLLYK